MFKVELSQNYELQNYPKESFIGRGFDCGIYPASSCWSEDVSVDHGKMRVCGAASKVSLR
jgi:hypothetical protein